MTLNGDLFKVEDESTDNGARIFTLCLNPQHWIFSVHFPEQPIVPGVCLMQTVLELASACIEKRLYIKEIRNVKFQNVVSPLENQRIICTLDKLEPADGGFRVQARIVGADAQQLPLAKLSMLLTEAPV